MASTSILGITPPLVILRGRQEAATYRHQDVPEYKGNPLVESLPQLYTLAEVTELLAHFPYYSEEQRKLPAEVRLHMIENARELFIPQGLHLQIHLSISNMIRRGYLQRNPTEWGFWKKQNNQIESLKSGPSRKIFLQSKARGFAIYGIGGMGKSTTVENILSLYPQVITHTHYCNQDLVLRQLVWLKLQCPNDGSIKGLCLNFFQVVDDILGTNYFDRYGSNRRTVDELLPQMGRVAALHCLGALVIDEIQDLSEAKSGGSSRMINFFVQLENTIGVPFLLIGSPLAKLLFSRDFRQARRVSEQGDVYWEPMKMVDISENNDQERKINPIWEQFIRALWKYQYVQVPSPLGKDLLGDKLSETLYEESQGITAVAVTLYYLAQQLAIASGSEKITPSVIRQVAKEKQRVIQPMLNRLKEGKKIQLGPTAVRDLDLFNVETLLEKLKPNCNGIESRGHIQNDPATPEATSNACLDSAEGVGTKANVSVKQPRPKYRKKPNKLNEEPGPALEKGDLRNISLKIAKGLPVSEAINQSGLVKSATDLLKGKQ